MQSEPIATAPSRPGGLKNVSLILSIVAVVLAAGALGAAVAIPGPAGPAGAKGATGANGTNGSTGARGPTGPAGNGTMMAHFIDFTSTTLGTTCTDTSQVATLRPSTRGNVTITASVVVQIAHTSGTEDQVQVLVSTSAFGSCSDTAGIADVPASAATDTYIITVPVALSSPVSAAGVYAYWISGIATGTASITFATGYVVFYPG